MTLTSLIQTASDSGVLITAALPVELRLLIDHFSAKRIDDAGPWPVYSNADRSVILLETGVGAVSAAAAVAHCFAYFSLSSHWSVLNVGIAGSGAYPVGQWVMALDVMDTTNNMHFYLRPPRIAGVQRTTVRSYPMPSDDYGLPAVLDMEASAVVAAARRFVSFEQIAVAKLVSDGSVAQRQGIDKKSVQQLLQKKQAVLLPIIEHYRKYSQQQAEKVGLPELPSELLESVHFSVSNKRKLTRLWRSYRVFFPLQNLSDMNHATAKDVLRFFEEKLASVKLHWEDKCD